MKKLLLLLMLWPAIVLGQNYALQLNGTAKITMSGTALITIDQSSTTGIYRSSVLGGIVCDNEQSRIIWKAGTGTGTYVIPFLSTDGDNVTTSVTINTAGTGAGAIVASTYHTPPNNTPYPANSGAWFPNVTNLLDQYGADNSANVVDRFWLVTYNGYTLNPSATLTLNYDATGALNDLGSISETDLQAEYWDGTTWSPYSPLLGVADPANHQVINIPAGNYNAPWVLVNKNFPLPVDLLSFTSDCGILSWVTASESNCDYYQILFSPDGREYTLAGTVDGSGNSNVQKKYSFDTGIKEGYFKLMQIDYDGNAHIYGPIAGYCNADQSRFEIYPNPFNESVTILCSQPCKLEIWDSHGKLVKIISLDSFNRLDLTDLSSGMYTFKMISNDLIHIEKIIKNGR